MRIHSLVHSKEEPMMALANAILHLSKQSFKGDRVLVVGSFLVLSKVLDFPAFQKRMREEHGVHVYSNIRDFQIEKMVYGGRDITEVGLKQLFLKGKHVITRDVFLNGSAKGDPVPGIMKHLLVVLKSGGVKMYYEGNGFLFRDLVLEDPEDVLTLRYGCPDIIVDVTEYLLSKARPVTRFHLPSKTNLNSLDGDPMPDTEKELILDYVLVDENGQEHRHQEILPEHDRDDLYLDLDVDGYFETHPSSAPLLAQKDLENIIATFPVLSSSVPASLLSSSSSVSVVHVVLEEKFDLSVYQRLILMHVPRRDSILLVGGDHSELAWFLKECNRDVFCLSEEAAMVEKLGNSVFIGKQGSSSSDFLSTHMAAKKVIFFKGEEIFIRS